MNINEYLNKHQPIIFHTIVNAIEQDHLSHAYLLCGSPGMPLNEVALFIAKSIICEHRNPLACNECLTCLRIDEGNYLDIKIIGGSKTGFKNDDVQEILDRINSLVMDHKLDKDDASNTYETFNYLINSKTGLKKEDLKELIESAISVANKRKEVDIEDVNDVIEKINLVASKKSTIKKEDTQDIIEAFSLTASEKAGKVIYIINCVETMTTAAVNSLLKFLEEPGKDVYAILTTENETKVLPTIISRTQTLKMRAIERDKIIEEAVSYGVNKEDAELLSYLYNDGETIKSYSEGKQYALIKEMVLDTIEALNENKLRAAYVMDKDIIPNAKTNDIVRTYLSLLSTVFQDILNTTYKTDITLLSYTDIINDLSKKLKHIAYSLRAILAAKNKLEINVNIPLLLDHVIYEITREDI
ncbi:MAG: hypothetical protein MJ248_05675 [Bacilli bacterium]|nr:hypothetical protein [Bacilli bacterium]